LASRTSLCLFRNRMYCGESVLLWLVIVPQ
jgi:hypothetical protein